MKGDPTRMIGSNKLKVLVAPNDPSPYDRINWQWPYTGNETVYQQTLTSYAPNVRVFGKRPDSGSWSVWDVAWHNGGGGKTTIPAIADGTSNTLAVVERPMVIGDATLSYKDWSVNGGTPPDFSDGVGTWAVTDMPPEGLAFFGCNCEDPNAPSRNGMWGASDCHTVKGDPQEYFHPPQPLPIATQQNAFNIYPINSGGVQALMCDGSVRMITTSISVRAWSAAVTPTGGEAVSTDQQ
jgi:prepilin-type processing-associated H-X9-DG protein